MDQNSGTVIVRRYEDAARNADAGSNSYKGLRIHALAGLHEFVGLQANQFLQPGASVLDLAAGSGAMSQRLQDLGFSVWATDYVQTGFKLLDSVPFCTANLNHDFATLFDRRFDAVVASEIIEHLENPRHFAREIRKLLKPGGRLILSTPNVDSMQSKVMFLTTGKFLWFEEQQYKSDGHISPLSQWQIDKVFAEAGFSVVSWTSFGRSFDRLRTSPRLRLLCRMLALLTPRQAERDGEIFVCVLQGSGE